VYPRKGLRVVSLFSWGLGRRAYDANRPTQGELPDGKYLADLDDDIAKEEELDLSAAGGVSGWVL
jgi:hypothetical protein